MRRTAGLLMMFAIAVSLGLYLAYREKANRERAVVIADGPARAATGEGAAPAANPAPAPGLKPADPKPPAPAVREQPKRTELVSTRVEPRPEPRSEDPT